MADPLIKKLELEQRQKNANQAGSLFNTTQFEVKKERVAAAERVGWFAAATISLSFTLIGYLFSNGSAQHILSEEIFINTPLVNILIIGWMCLLLSVLASLLVRLWSALHLNYNSAYHWSSENRKSKEVALEAIASGMVFMFTDAENDEEAKENVEESKKNYAKLETDFQHRSKFWLKAHNFAQAFVYVGAMSGILLLSIFLMIVTYRLTFS
ncbi:MAG: hypothetical protein JWM39_896 [Parcubacteria group bacterium]|nr:hypothetical protein [Parcubacteria group bacterium]